MIAFAALCGCSSFGTSTSAVDEAGVPVEAGVAPIVDAGHSDGARNSGGPRDGLVLALDFEEADPTIARDSSGAANDGTIFGATRVPGVHGNALAFTSVSSTGSSLLVPSSSSLDIGGPELTIAFWLRIELPIGSGDQVVLSKTWEAGSMVTPYHQFGVELNASSKTLQLFLGTNASTEPERAVITPAFGTWVHIAWVAGDGRMTGFVNGSGSSPEVLAAPIERRGNGLYLGQDVAGGQQFVGALDEVRIYNRALTPSEVSLLAAR